MNKASDILERKGSNIISLDPESTVLEALTLMAEKNIGSVMIMSNNEFLGIVTERDYCRKVILKGKSSTETKVKDIMSTNFPRISPSDSVDHCMTLISTRNVRYLPVFESGAIAGIISINDVVRETIIAQEETISQLKDYLHASM